MIGRISSSLSLSSRCDGPVRAVERSGAIAGPSWPTTCLVFRKLRLPRAQLSCVTVRKRSDAMNCWTVTRAQVVARRGWWRQFDQLKLRNGNDEGLVGGGRGAGACWRFDPLRRCALHATPTPAPPILAFGRTAPSLLGVPDPDFWRGRLCWSGFSRDIRLVSDIAAEAARTTGRPILWRGPAFVGGKPHVRAQPCHSGRRAAPTSTRS